MKKLNRVGERYITNEGYEIEIIKYNSARDCAIKFTVNNQINNLIKVNRNKEFPLGVLKNNNRFSAFIVRNQKTKNLGTFITPEEAFKAYKIAKEQYIKEVADKWKDKIDSKVYQAMYNYKVEITD